MSLLLRRRADGTVRVTGDTPTEHAFTPTFLARAVEDGYASVTVTLHTDDGDLTYLLQSFTDDDGGPNTTALRCQLQTPPTKKGR